MINKIMLVLTCLIFVACSNKKSTTNLATKSEEMGVKQSIHQFTVKSITGETVDLSSFKGKKIMIVNTASKCGLTPQYKQLEEVYSLYKDANFVVIGFPANNFGAQEPGSNAEIATFCEANYGVTFPMMEKISVSGKDMHPLYKFLTQKNKNGVQDSEVSWNFQKYLLNAQGELEQVLSPKTKPNDLDIIAWIKK